MSADSLFDDEPEDQGSGWDVEVKKASAMIATAQQIPDASMVQGSKALAAKVWDEVNLLVVDDAESYQRGCELSIACQQAIKAAKDNPKLKEGWEAAKNLHKWFTDLISSLTKPYADARKIVDEKTGRWHRAEQARVDAENRERQRLADKAARKERLDRAEAIAKERPEAAKAILEAPVQAAPVEKVEVAKVEGVSHRENWKWEGEDLMATIKAVAAGEAPASVLSWNEKELTRRAKALKGTFSCAGIRVYDAGSTAVRS